MASMVEKSFSEKVAPVLVVLLVITAFLVGILWAKVSFLEGKLGGGKNGKTEGTAKPVPTQPSKVEVKIKETNPVKGKKEAKIKIVEFSDFQCPFCGAFSGHNKELVSSMKSRNASWEPLFPGLQFYIDKDQVVFAYKHFAFLGQESNWAAEASKCANEQGKFWEYYDHLFSNQKGENQGQFNKENLKKFAVTLGLNTSSFNECLDAGKYTKEVQDETSEGRSLGVSGTPATFINGRMVGGAESFATIKGMIEEELKN